DSAARVLPRQSERAWYAQQQCMRLGRSAALFSVFAIERVRCAPVAVVSGNTRFPTTPLKRLLFDLRHACKLAVGRTKLEMAGVTNSRMPILYGSRVPSSCM